MLFSIFFYVRNSTSVAEETEKGISSWLLLKKVDIMKNLEIVFKKCICWLEL